MQSNKSGRYVVFSAIGFIIFIAGLVLVIIKTTQDTQGIMRTLPYLCVGIGAGILGQNLGELLRIYAERKNPQAARKIEIEAKDERNIMIANKAKAKAYDLMIMVFAALLLAFALMQVDVYVILALSAAYLFVIFSNIYYLSKLQKEM